MITFSKLGKLGRLGNQLFQYAAIRGLSIKNSYEFKIPKVVKNFHGQEYLLNNFSIPEDKFSYLTFPLSLINKKYKEKSAEFIDKNFFSISDNIDLEGYFQSIFYFKHCINIIKQDLKPKKIFLEEAGERMNKIKRDYPDYQIISLHLRRGDNTDRNISHNDKRLLNIFGEQKFDLESFYGRYMFNSKKIFQKIKAKFLVFSGGNRVSDDNLTDLEWCKENLIGDEYIFNEPNKSFQDFCLIGQCDHNIISPVSSFGWWAAFLSANNGITVAPEKYDPSIPNLNYRYMFYPEDWILV